jgi:hypothetical protein
MLPKWRQNHYSIKILFLVKNTAKKNVKLKRKFTAILDSAAILNFYA